MRLNKVVADQAGLSRRAADQAILGQRVRLDGALVAEPSLDVSSDAELELDGRKLQHFQPIVVALNKPRGVTSTVRDEHAERTAVELLETHPMDGRTRELLDKQMVRQLAPAGRLDRESRGLLILTNDGELQQRITHPSHLIEREYELVLKRASFIPFRVEQAISGVTDSESGEHLAVDECRVLANEDNQIRVRVVMHTGRKHELRRLFRQLGWPVLDVVRQRIGRLRLSTLELAEGRWTVLTQTEIQALGR